MKTKMGRCAFLAQSTREMYVSLWLRAIGKARADDKIAILIHFLPSAENFLCCSVGRIGQRFAVAIGDIAHFPL